MTVLHCPASYLPSIMADIQRAISELDRMPAEQRAIFLNEKAGDAIIMLGAVPADAEAKAFLVAS